MKFVKQVLGLISVVCLIAIGFSAGPKTLAELYKTGKVRFVQELMLDEKTMPKDVLFAGPGALDCDAAGNVYVMDFSDNNIKAFGASGKFLKLIGRKGQGPGEFSMPIDVVVAKDRLIVWDMGNDRLCALTMSGALIKAENASAFSGRPVKVEALPTGEIVLETEKTYFNEPDRPQDRFLEILAPDLQTKNRIYSQPVLRNKYMRIGGQLFNIPQPFGPDIYWSISPSGMIAVGFSGKYEVAFYDKKGAEALRFSHPHDPVKVTAEDEKDFFDGMSYSTGTGVKRGAPVHIVKNTTFPKFKPAFNALIVDSDGNTLVHPYRKSKEEMYRYFDAFDAQGRFIATVYVDGDIPFPVQFRKSRIVDGCFWIVKYSSDEVPHIIKYRIAE